MLTISPLDARIIEGGKTLLAGTLSWAYNNDVFLDVMVTGATTGFPQLGIESRQMPAFFGSLRGQDTSQRNSLPPTANSAVGGQRHGHLRHPVEPRLLCHWHTVDGDAADPERRRRAGHFPKHHRKAGGHRGNTQVAPPHDLRPGLGQPLPVPPACPTGACTSWAETPGSARETTGHTFTGLTNETEYTYKVRAGNSNHNGAAAQVQVTPGEGIEVPTGATSVSITEVLSATLTLGAAPAAGMSVTVPIGAGGLDSLVSPPWRGLAVRLTRRPRQRGQHCSPTGSVPGCLYQEFPQGNINVDIVEFEVEGSLHVGRADEARRSVILTPHLPHFLALGEGHPPPVVAASDGAFDRHFSGHWRNFTTPTQGVRT